MFDYLPDVGRQLRGELVQVYWTLLVPLVVLLIIIEFFKSDAPNVKEIVRRVVISILSRSTRCFYSLASDVLGPKENCTFVDLKGAHISLE